MPVDELMQSLALFAEPRAVVTATGIVAFKHPHLSVNAALLKRRVHSHFLNSFLTISFLIFNSEFTQ